MAHEFTGSRDDLTEHMTGNSSQSKIAAGIPEGQTLMVETRQVQDCGV